MADRVRAGIVGTGFMGTVHARVVRSVAGVVSRIVGSTPASSYAARITDVGLVSSRTSRWVEVVPCLPS